MTLSFRRADNDDAPAIADVHIAAWRAAYEGLVPNEVLAELTAEDVAARWRLEFRRTSEGGSEVWVAEVDQDLVAYARFGPPRDADSIARGDTGEIYGFYVHPERWGVGVGRGLMDRVGDVFREAGIARVTLNVVTANEPARAFYERMGFVPDGPATPWHGAEQLRYSREL